MSSENRLRQAQTYRPADPPQEEDIRLTFAYDYLGRRVRKRVFTYDFQQEQWKTTPDADLQFVYDGWNVVLVLYGLDGPDEGTEPDNTVLTKYTWGLDLSGLTGRDSTDGIHGAGGIGGLLTIEDVGAGSIGGLLTIEDVGAGGIGGLLAAVETQNTSSTADDKAYWFFCDANGNVGQAVNASGIVYGTSGSLTSSDIAAKYEYDPYQSVE